MVHNILDILILMDNDTKMDILYLKMEIIILDNGKIINLMVKEFIFLLMKNDMKVLLKMVNEMVREHFIILMVKFIKVSGLIIKKKIME